MQFNHGVAGKSTREMARKRFGFVCVFGAVLLGIALLLFLNLNYLIKFGFGAAAVMIVGVLSVARLIEARGLAVKKRAKDAERGAMAEEKVAEKLLNLPDGYKSFHDISFNGFNVDHMVIGPGGIFLIETKSHRGKVERDGDSLHLNGKPPEKDFLKQAWSQTLHLKEFLYRQTSKKWKVHPVLCFSNAFVDVREPVKGVTVSRLGYLNQYLLRQPEVLGGEDIEHLSKVMSFWNSRYERKG